MKNSQEKISKVLSVLNDIKDPILNKSYLDLEALDSISDDTGSIKLMLKIGMHSALQQKLLAPRISAQMENAGLTGVNVDVTANVLPCPDVNSQGHLSEVKNIVMVASGKGGVGKSTTAVNLALALHAEGAKVGILDADIYGPSQRVMLGVADNVKPELVDEKYLKPITKFGVKSMSVGYMSAEKTPMVWRGSMAVRALQQFLEQTLWGELDYLIIDMPPGTGDIQISLAQQIKVSGALIVTTPQEMALIDARKGLEMFKKVGIPVLGIVENMATHICTHCGQEDAIFGHGGASKLAKEYGVAQLGSLPLDTHIREDVDKGIPTVAANPSGTLAQAYINLANQLGAQLWNRNLSPALVPEIVISQS